MLRAGARPPDAASPGPSSAPETPRRQELDVDLDMGQLYATINEYLLLEHKFQPRLCLPADCENGEVSWGTRDGAAHVLRCLRVWFDLPADVLINAINLFDRFLTKMKVRGCHVPCITVSCMNLALEQHAAVSRTPRAVSAEELVAVSQSACTAGDVGRMSQVIAAKLELNPLAGAGLSPLHWLRALRGLVVAAATELQLPPCLEESELVHLLEIAMCDAVCANARMSELAIVLIYHRLEQHMVEWSKPESGFSSAADTAYDLFELGAQIQQHCRMSDASLVSTRNRVRLVVGRYEARGGSAVGQRQRLVWRLSSRTLRLLRPTARLGAVLPTILEGGSGPKWTDRHRSDSESSNEETSGWPRSPVVPVYCDTDADTEP